MSFIWLIFAHLFGDIVFQNSEMNDKKRKDIIVMIAHCAVWTSCISIGLEYLGILSLYKILFLFFGHYLIDIWKIKKTKNPFWRSIDGYGHCSQGFYFVIDQFLHFIQLIIVYFL